MSVKDTTLFSALGKLTGAETLCSMLEFVVLEAASSNGIFYSNQMVYDKASALIEGLSYESYNKYIAKFKKENILLLAKGMKRGVYTVNPAYLDMSSAQNVTSINNQILGDSKSGSKLIHN